MAAILVLTSDSAHWLPARQGTRLLPASHSFPHTSATGLAGNSARLAHARDNDGWVGEAADRVVVGEGAGAIAGRIAACARRAGLRRVLGGQDWDEWRHCQDRP